MKIPQNSWSYSIQGKQ